MWMWILYLPSDFRVASSQLLLISQSISLPNPQYSNKGQTTTPCPTLHALLFTSPADHNIEDAGDGAYGVHSPSPRRPQRLTICRYNYKGNTFSSVIKDPECRSGLGHEPSTCRTAVQHSTNWANQAAKITTYGLKSTFYTAAKVWNAIPNNLRSVAEFDLFRNLIRKLRNFIP